MKKSQHLIFVLSNNLGQGTEHLLDYLETTGVIVDRKYGVVPLNIEKTKFALRGTASKKVVETLQHDTRLEMWPDSELDQQ